METAKDKIPPFYYVVAFFVSSLILIFIALPQNRSSAAPLHNAQISTTSSLPQSLATQPSDPQSPLDPPIPTATPVPNPCAGFNDLATTDYSCPAVQYMVNHGYITGLDTYSCTNTAHAQYPCYGPASFVTRADFSRILANTYENSYDNPSPTPRAYIWQPYVSSTPTFSDVPPSYYAYPQIQTTAHYGVVTGYDHTTCAAHGLADPCFLPANNITRAELTAFLARARNFAPYYPAVSHFSDVQSCPNPPNCPDWYSGYLEALYHNSIIYPDSQGHYNAPVHLSRADTAYYIYRSIYLANVSSYLGQGFGVIAYSPGLWGIDVLAPANFTNDDNSVSWSAGPTGMLNLLQGNAWRFLESGPYRGSDGQYHPYSTWRTQNGRDGNTDQFVSLFAGTSYRYYSRFDPSNGTWSAFYCEPNNGSCKAEADRLNFDITTFPYAASNAETSNQLVHLGVINPFSVKVRYVNTYQGVYTCYSYRTTNAPDQSVSDCTGLPNNPTWTITWPVGLP